MTHIDNTARAAVEGAEPHDKPGYAGPGEDAVYGGWDRGPELNLKRLHERVCAVLGDDVRITLESPLDDLPRRGFIYLGSPYSKQPDFDEAADLAEQAAARLMRRGLTVYAPIAHGHAIARHGLPADWSFWKRQCEPFIEAAAALVVLKLDGWRDSVGLTYEIARFHEAGKPIVYVTMEDLANG